MHGTPEGSGGQGLIGPVVGIVYRKEPTER